MTIQNKVKLRYRVQPKKSDRTLLGIYKFEVFDSDEHRVIAYTRLESDANNYADQMNAKGFIEP